MDPNEAAKGRLDYAQVIPSLILNQPASQPADVERPRLC